MAASTGEMTGLQNTSRSWTSHAGDTSSLPAAGLGRIAQIEPPLDAFDALGQMIDANVTFGRAFFGVGHVTAQSCHRNLESRSEEHTSELQSLMRISYAVFCLKKNNIKTQHTDNYIALSIMSLTK